MCVKQTKPTTEFCEFVLRFEHVRDLKDLGEFIFCQQKWLEKFCVLFGCP